MRQKLPTWGVWKGKPPKDSKKKFDFEYVGSVESGTTIYFGKDEKIFISKENYTKLLERFKGQTVTIGTPHEKDLPQDTVGGFLQKILETQTVYASYVGPILIHEGYAIKGEDQSKIEFF
jgi:hypothetical protein